MYFIILELEPKNENPFILQNIAKDEKHKRTKITALEFADDQSTITVGQASKYVLCMDCETNLLEEVKVKHSPVVGLAKGKDFLIVGFENGQIEKISHKTSESSTFKSGDNIARLRINPYNTNVFATGGKGRQNSLKIFDTTMDKHVFASKNLPNDHLQLEVPIWDNDMGFLSESVIATCSRYGYLRVYDVRKQRRPVLMYSNDKDNALKFTTITIHGDNSIFTGCTMGELRMFDVRNLKTFAHTYKGCTGSISNVAVDKDGKHLVSTSLDRYIRIHNVDSCEFLYQCYVKSKPTAVLVK